MTRPLSIDLRERVIDAVDGGMSRRAAAKRFGVSISAAIKWVQRWRETGNRRPHAQGGDYRSHRIEAHGEEIFALVDDQRDITLVEITGHLEQECDLCVAPSTVWRFFERHNVTFKKNRTRQRTRSA
jgi:transposase